MTGFHSVWYVFRVCVMRVSHCAVRCAACVCLPGPVSGHEKAPLPGEDKRGTRGEPKKDYFTTPANSAPGLNLITFLASIWIFSLVAGLIPVRAGRSVTAKVPNPRIATLSPSLSAPEMASITASRACLESALLRPVAAMALTRSGLLIV